MRHIVLLLLVIAALGCQSKSETATPAAPATTPVASTTPVAAPGETGVAECDDYLRKWDACLATKVSGEAREQVKVALDATRDAWKRAIATPEGKAGLAAACREATEIAKMQVSAYGCSW